MGFFLENPDTGTVVGQFPHLFPGVDRDRLRPRRPDRRAADGRRSGRCSACWRCTSPARACSAAPAARRRRRCSRSTSSQVWFARYPNAEMVMQALLFAALLANARAHVDGDRVLRAGRRVAARPAAVPALRRGARRSPACWRRSRSACSPASAPRVVVLRGARSSPAALACRRTCSVPMRRVRRPAARVPHPPRRGGSTRCSAPGRGAACWRWSLGARRPALSARVRTIAPDAARGRAWSALALYALVPAPPGGKLGRLRRLRAANVRELLPHAAGAARRARRLRAARARDLLARSGALHHRRRVLVLLLLQDPHLPGALLDGAAVPAGDPARRAAASPRPRR